MQPQRQPKQSPAGTDAGLDRDDVEYILGTFEEDGKVTPHGQKDLILDIYDRMRFQGGAYESPLDPPPGMKE